jgi:Mg2+ and Co2+ transporter CorA
MQQSEETKILRQLIEEVVAPLRTQIETLENQVEELEREVDNKVGENHYHEDYASADHVERSENGVNSRLHRIEESVGNVEYRVSDAERKASDAQRAAEQAQRSAGNRGYY